MYYELLPNFRQKMPDTLALARQRRVPALRMNNNHNQKRVQKMRVQNFEHVKVEHVLGGCALPWRNG